jgi:hypothetical protein
MTLIPLKRNWHKVTLTIFLIFTATILVLALVVNSYLSPILAQKVKDVVLKSSDSLYTIDFPLVEFHILRGTIVVYNITVKPDTLVYNRLKKQHLAPNNLVELKVRRLTVSDVHAFELLFHDKLDIGEILLNEPTLHVSYQLNHVKDTVAKDNRTPWQKMAKSLRSIRVGKIVLGDIKFKYEDYSGNKVLISELKELNLSAFDLLIDSTTQADKNRLLYCKNIVAELNNYEGKTPNGLYIYRINSLMLSTAKSQLDINGLTLNPIDKNTFFTKSKGDRFSLRIDSARLNNFDFLNYHKYRILNIASLSVKSGAIQIFANPNKHDTGADRITTFPNAALKKLDLDLKIDTLSVNNFNVLYNEYNEKSDKTGSVIFNNANALALNITTNKAALQKNNVCSISIGSYFMNRARLTLAMDFNLTDEKNSFSYKGQLGPMDLKYVNPAAMPLGMVKITKGTLKQFIFNIKANRSGDEGRVGLLYNNLTVSVLKPDTIFDNLRRKPIATLFVNLFIVKHNNPDVTDGVPRSVYVKYTRTPATPFFKSVWQTLFNGIKPCVGLTAEVQQAVIAMTKQQIINKENRKIKKEARKKRRELRKVKREERRNKKALQQNP